MATSGDQNGKKQWVTAEKYIQVGVTLPAATLIGWIVGVLLDRWLHTKWLFMAGLILGIVAGFVQLMRVAIDAGKDTGKKD
jgi:F0F1-type ATP synthase assembly protein I